MRPLSVLVLTTALAALPAVPALADDTTGTILAFDRVANIIVLDDKTVWPIGSADLALPENLMAGDVITIDFRSDGDNGVAGINSITRAPG